MLAITLTLMRTQILWSRGLPGYGIGGRPHEVDKGLLRSGRCCLENLRTAPSAASELIWRAKIKDVSLWSRGKKSCGFSPYEW